MDENRIEGAADNIGGKLKDAVGGLTGDSKLQAEGKADQVGGKLQNAYGSAKDAVSENAGDIGAQVETFVKNQPITALVLAVGVGYLLRAFTAPRD